MEQPMAVLNGVEIKNVVFVGQQVGFGGLNQTLIYFYDENTGHPMMSEECEISNESKNDQIVYNECNDATLMMIENRWVWVRKIFVDHDKLASGEITTIPDSPDIDIL